MGMLSVSWWLLSLPLLCQTLPSKVGDRDLEWAGEDRIEEPSLQQVVLNETGNPDDAQDALQNLECGLKESQESGPGWGNLETHGVFRNLENVFLDGVKQESWETGNLDKFGMCTDDKPLATLTTMKHLANVLTEPQGKHLVVLHLDKLEWEPSTSLQFMGTVQEHILPLIQHSHMLMLVFYLDTQKRNAKSHTSKILVSVEGDPHGQVVCMSSDTHYLILRVRENVRNIISQDLQIRLCVHMKDHSNGLALSKTEAQRLFFGTDKCLTKMYPALFMVVGHKHQAAASLSVPGGADHGNIDISLQGSMATVPAVEKDEFLETLSHFSSIMLRSKGKAASTIHLPLDPTDHSLGDLRPHLFNVTEVEALEWLVESQEPLVFLFLPGSKCLLATRFQEKLDGALLERMTVKIQNILEELEELLSGGEHVQILQHLLSFCHGTFNISYLSTEENLPQLGKGQHRKLHSLMLLKALQTIRSYWQDRTKLSRQHRGAGVKPHCRLQELIINLRPYAEYKNIHHPDKININNCVGPCHFPQTTQSDYQAHVVLLIQLQERRQLDLSRPPCCVPVKYQGQWLMVADENGLRLQLYPNMVAKECGCR
ncbi:muellerian-inhibiting factor [Spea bombifrons]|uniref:muellerian-inhibiting factor n=1 Tax=Spea bombifrons TaxID=233779 RepID=UPI00234B21DD|nr:muellerian-inhibiting factor [Spea bombifrons]